MSWRNCRRRAAPAGVPQSTFTEDVAAPVAGLPQSSLPRSCYSGACLRTSLTIGPEQILMVQTNTFCLLCRRIHRKNKKRSKSQDCKGIRVSGYEPLKNKAFKVFRLPYHTSIRHRRMHLLCMGKGDNLVLINHQSFQEVLRVARPQKRRAGHAAMAPLQDTEAYNNEIVTVHIQKLYTCEPPTT